LLKGYGHFVHTFLCLNGGGTEIRGKIDQNIKR